MIPPWPLAAELERKALEFVKIRTADLTAAADVTHPRGGRANKIACTQ